MVEQNKVELKDLPPGNEWVLSCFNKHLTPVLYRYESWDLSNTTRGIRRIVDSLKNGYTTKEWEFVAFLGSNNGFAVVFAHPLRNTMVEGILEPDFLEEKRILQSGFSGENTWLVNREGINKALVNANLYAYNAFGGYNSYELEIKKGILQRVRKVELFQTGVAYIAANLQSLDDRRELIAYDVAKKRKSFERSIKSSIEELKRIDAIKTSNPQPLF